MTEAFQIFALLLGWHALADYPLQGDFLARAKNRAAPIPGVPWYQAMGAHVAIHALGVWLITGVWWMGAIEAVAHFATDDAKCRGKIGFNTDQFLHIALKTAFAVILWGQP